MGKNITEKEIDSLRKSYEQTEKTNDTLSLQQLDDIAVGLEVILIYMAKVEHSHILAHPEDGYSDTYPGFHLPAIEYDSFVNP